MDEIVVIRPTVTVRGDASTVTIKTNDPKVTIKKLG